MPDNPRCDFCPIPLANALLCPGRDALRTCERMEAAAPGLADELVTIGEWRAGGEVFIIEPEEHVIDTELSRPIRYQPYPGRMPGQDFDPYYDESGETVDTGDETPIGGRPAMAPPAPGPFAADMPAGYLATARTPAPGELAELRALAAARRRCPDGTRPPDSCGCSDALVCHRIGGELVTRDDCYRCIRRDRWQKGVDPAP